MRAPLSWLRDFAPFERDAQSLAATLDDLGLVVDAVEVVGEGIDDVVVAQVVEIGAIKGADRIRRVVVDAGAGPVEVVCGAWNFAVGDLVALAPVGSVLPGDFAIEKRKMKGVVSNGMLCSGKELGLSSDHLGILVLSDVEGARPGMSLIEALGVEPDVVFDITVEGNRPDAWCMAGVARDLAARLALPFTLPDPAPAPVGLADVGSLASLTVGDLDLCPRMNVVVIGPLTIGPSPRWLARRLTLAGMRPINNVVDASNYVMLELGQPTHPYDLALLGGAGLIVRRARTGETLVTLDGTERLLGTPGRGLGDTGEDCVICDANNQVIGVAGIMGGASTEITDETTSVLLETAYFTPMAIARTSKRLGLRTEASARFERGTDPAGIERAAKRFCELVGAPVAVGALDVVGQVPTVVTISVPLTRVNSVLGTEFSAGDVAQLLEPIGFGAEPGPGSITVSVPTNRPDVRPAPFGIDDVVEEVGRTYGYAKLPRRQPSWPEPGALNGHQRERRALREVLCGLGASQAWTPSFLADADHARVGLDGPAVRVANPLDHKEAVLRRSLLPGLLGALSFNADRRQSSLRLFEVGTVFAHPDEGHSRHVERAGAEGGTTAVLPEERELITLLLALEGDDSANMVGDDATTAVAAWRVLAEARRIRSVAMVAVDPAQPLPGLHPTRSARLVVDDGTIDPVVLGAVGEVDPVVVAEFALGSRRIGYLEIDLGRLDGVPRRSDVAHTFSRFPSSDVDLAFVVDEALPAAVVERTLFGAGGEELVSVTLFDVYRGEGIAAGSRSLAYRLRFVAADHTMTDEEVGTLRQRCIDAVTGALGVVLR